MIYERPEPVMNASLLAGALITLVKLVLVMLATLGVVDLTDGEQATIAAVVAGLADVVIILVTMWYGARAKVTSTKDPMAENTRGELVPLIPADGSTLAKD